MPWRRAISEMVDCIQFPQDIIGGGGADLTVFERQQARLKWQQDQQLLLQVYMTGTATSGGGSPHLQALQPFPIFPNTVQSMNAGKGWPGLVHYPVQLGDPSINESSATAGFSGNNSCSLAAGVAEEDRSVPVSPAKMKDNGGDTATTTTTSSSGPRKRKAEDANYSVVVNNAAATDIAHKKIKGECDGATMQLMQQIQPCTNTSNSRKEASGDSSKQSSKKSEVVQKTDYIHVRARRGQATDSHSLAERVRREKISERMKYLQDLVPGCNKITGKAGMLDEIINYVQSLQRQIEFLSMKLAAVNPVLDFNSDVFPIIKHNVPSCCGGVSVADAAGVPSEIMDSSFVSSLNHPMQQSGGASCGLDMGMYLKEMVPLRQATNVPVAAVPNAFNEACFNIPGASPAWDPAALQSLFNGELHYAKASPSPITQSSEDVLGVESNNVKIKMRYQ